MNDETAACSNKSAWDAKPPTLVKMQKPKTFKPKTPTTPNVSPNTTTANPSADNAAPKTTAPKTHHGGTHNPEKNGLIKSPSWLLMS